MLLCRAAKQGSAAPSSRKPEWDDSVIVPQEKKGARETTSLPTVKPFRARTPAKVLEEVTCLDAQTCIRSDFAIQHLTSSRF